MEGIPQVRYTVFCISIPFTEEKARYMLNVLWNFVDLWDQPNLTRYYGVPEYRETIFRWSDMYAMSKFIDSPELPEDDDSPRPKLSPKSIIQLFSPRSKDKRDSGSSSPRLVRKSSSPRTSPRALQKWVNEMIGDSNYVVVFCEGDTGIAIYKALNDNVRKILVSTSAI